MEIEEEQRKQRKIYLAGLKKSHFLYDILEEMARENGQTLEKWIASFDAVRQDAFLVLAPILCGFVIWVLQRAMTEGKKRLYFIARDGYLMYRLAELFCRTLELDVECRYLYCSRYSLRIPAFHLDMDGALDFICRGGIDVTMEKILNRSGLGGKEKKKVLDMLRLPYARNEVIPYARLRDVRKRLAKCEYFLNCVEKNSRMRKPGLIGYLEQEGLLGRGTADALVDSGWTGSMQKTLGEVLVYHGRKEPLHGYYFGLYELPEGVSSDDYEAYYFGPTDGLRRKVYFSNCLFESVFSAPHGMTLGYWRKSGDPEEWSGDSKKPKSQKNESTRGKRRYEPILAGCADGRLEFAKRMEWCISMYGENLARVIKRREEFLHLDVHKFQEATCRLLKAFMGNPTRAEAEIFGDLRFSDDVLENTLYKTAAELTEKELTDGHVWNKSLVMLGIRKGLVRESAWYEGSVARSGRHKKYHQRMYAAYKYLLYMRQMGWKNT